MGAQPRRVATETEWKILQGSMQKSSGVSGDTAKNHQVFKKAHQLNFTLLADTDGKIAELFGVPVSKGEKTVTKSIDGVDVDLTRHHNGKTLDIYYRSGMVRSFIEMIE